MAPKINTSTASGSEQKLRKARCSTQAGRYAQLREAHVIILAAQEAKKASSTRQSTPIPISSSDSSDHGSDSDDTTSSTRKARKACSTRQARQIPTPSSDVSLVTVIDEKHARKARSTNVIWQHMSQQEVDGRKKNNL